MWRISRNGDLIEPLALRIHEFWRGFPKNRRIDAAYERQYDGAIIFITGNLIYRYAGTELVSGYPVNISDEFIMPPGTVLPKRFDAAIHWDDERLTYLFAADKFWKIDEYYAERKPRVRLIGPYKNTLWSDVPTHLDSAFIDRKGITHFMKGQRTWQFNRMELAYVCQFTFLCIFPFFSDQVREDFIGEKWFKCPMMSGQRGNEERDEANGIDATKESPLSRLDKFNWFRSSSSTFHVLSCKLFVLLYYCQVT